MSPETLVEGLAAIAKRFNDERRRMGMNVPSWDEWSEADRACNIAALEIALRSITETNRVQRELAAEVLARDAAWAASGMPNDCGCIGLSRDAEREYETGTCPHQRLRAALSAIAAPSEGGGWRPISEAPKTGNLWCAIPRVGGWWRYRELHWSDGFPRGEAYFVDEEGRAWLPIFWRPIIAPSPRTGEDESATSEVKG